MAPPSTASSSLVPFTFEFPTTLGPSDNKFVKAEVKKIVSVDPEIEITLEITGEGEYSEYFLTADVLCHGVSTLSWGEVPVSVMFHPEFFVNGRVVKKYVAADAGEHHTRALSRDEDDISGGREIVEGHLIISEALLFAPSRHSLLTDVAMRSADCIMKTSDGKDIPFHRLMLETRSGTEWERYFDGSTTLQKNEDGSKNLVTCLQEFSSGAVFLYREIVYTGNFNLAKSSWRSVDVLGLAEIATKMGEEDLVATMSHPQTISETPDRKAFLNWYTEGKGGFEELFLEARQQIDKERLAEIRAKKRKRDFFKDSEEEPV